MKSSVTYALCFCFRCNSLVLSTVTDRISAVQISNTMQGEAKLHRFLRSVVPEEIPYESHVAGSQTQENFIQDVFEGISASTMAVRIT